MSDPLKLSYERFLADRDEQALHRAIQMHGGRPSDPGTELPACHRICDIKVLGNVYRVVRVYDLLDCSTTIFVFLTDVPEFDEPGVPYALQGDALRQWIEDELKSPSKGSVDWTRYGLP